MVGTPRDIWEEILNRFDPDLVTRPEWRADREESPAASILSSLDRPHVTKVLLSGTIGSGKSTELLRIAEARARKGDEFVIALDLVRHFDKVVGDLGALQNVASWEVCFLAGVALIRAAKERLEYDFPADQVGQLAHAWSTLARKATGAEIPSIDILKLAKSMTLMASMVAAPVAAAAGASAVAGAAAAGGFKVLSELTGTGKWTLPFGKKGTKLLEDQDEVMQSLADKVNLLLGTFRQWSRPVLLVIDGLDRINDGERAKALLVLSQMIAGLDCRLVVCAPFAMRNDMAASRARGFRLRTLHNVPVLDQKEPGNPNAHGPGVRFLGEVFRSRVRDLRADGIIPPPLLDKLAYYSGGALRDFVQSINMLAERGWDDQATIVTEAQVSSVLREARLLVETGLDRGHIDLLKEVARDPERRLPDGQLARDLLAYGRLLPYPNESEWFYPHPLLMLNLVRP